jgi:enediyne biosynthesis protein E4
MEKAVALDENGNAQAGMGVDMGDFDNDGRFDLAVSNLDTEYLALYRNLGKRGFEDVSRRWGVASATTPHVGFGTRFIDFDNDGWLDLLVANGHILDNIELLRPQAHFAQPKVLLRNTGTRFEEVTALHGKALSSNRVSRGVAFGDFDNDGDIDVLVNNTSDHPQLLRNDRGNRNAWLALDLKGLSNGPATGAVVEVRVAGRMRTFQSLGGASYMAANDPRIHIGLGAAEVVDELVVRWPHGGDDRMKRPQLRRFMVVDETKGFSVKMGSSNSGPHDIVPAFVN